MRRSWHLIAAPSGSGKTSGLTDVLHQSGAYKRTDGQTIVPVLAGLAPTGKGGRTERAVGMSLLRAFGTIPNRPWDFLRGWMVEECHRADVELIVIDDAHQLDFGQLGFLKNLTDALRLPPFERELGVCLVSASSGGTIPLLETFNRKELMWIQLRRRLDPERPYVMVAGHSEEELAEILVGFEDLYRDQFPALDLVSWTRSIYAWLTHPTLDHERDQRVTMDNVTKLVTMALRAAWEQGLDAVDAKGSVLQTAAERMTLQPDRFERLEGEFDEAA